MSTTNPLPNAEQPTVFQKLLEPIEDFVKAQNRHLPKHRNQKYEYEDFFRLLIYYFVSGTRSLKLLVQTRLNAGLLSPELGLRSVAYSTCQDAFERFSPRLFQAVFQHLLSCLSFKAVPELATLGTLYCIDGSLFPVINSMLWAEYTTKHQALKLHLCFELNRMIPVEFRIGSGNSSEREALRTLLVAGVSYIADRGYMSFQLCHQVCQAQAHFIFRTKTNLVLTVVESLPISLPASARGLFSSLTDELIRYDNDPHAGLYRLVRFNIAQQAYYLLTDRRDLSTFQIILLYAYRWQIELLFRFLKRTMTGLHLIRHDEQGVTIQFHVMMITALLELYLKQQILDQQENQNLDGDGPDNLVQESGTAERQPPTPSKRLSGVEFVTWLNQKAKKYWKIGIHWLTALRDLLICPFDERAVGILSKL
ncbi:MAG: IS4 family transposase [bacterium]|nr:IS4 family transposase [bacterium]